MACDLKRTDVSAIVIRVLEDDNPDYRPITEDTPLGLGGLGLGAAKLRSYFIPIRNALEQRGCGIPSLSPNDFTTVDTVGKLIDLIFKALAPIPVQPGVTMVAASLMEKQTPRQLRSLIGPKKKKRKRQSPAKKRTSK